MADGVTQLLSANVQLDSALTQLEQGLRTLESSVPRRWSRWTSPGL